MTTGRKWMAACLCLTVLVSAGCEPLRKKFTRQKKKDDKVSNFIPVLEPIDYPAKQYGAKEGYAQHYSLFKIWFSDFDVLREQSRNEKKIIADLDAAINELTEMEKYLQGASKDELAKIKSQVQLIRNEFDKAKSFRNQARLNSDVRAIDMAVRKKLKPDVVETDLIN